MAVSTETARQEARAAWPSDTPFSEDRLRFVLAVSRLETGYGDGWSGAGAGSGNMGAITAGSSWAGDTFQYGDSRPDGQGGDVSYVTRFRKYPNRSTGWADFARFLMRRIGETVDFGGNAHDVAQAMYDSRYFLGLGTQTPAQRVATYAARISEGLRRQAQTDPDAARLVGDSPAVVIGGGAPPEGAPRSYRGVIVGGAVLLAAIALRRLLA